MAAAIRSLIVVHMIISHYTCLHCCCCCCIRNLAFDFAFMVDSHSANNRKGTVSPWEYRLLMAIDIANALADDDQIDSNFHTPRLMSRDILSDPTTFGCEIGNFNIFHLLFYKATRSTSDDMYGFGVALMEIITGKPMCQIGDDHDVHNSLLTEWVSSMFEEGEIGSIVDPKLRGEFDINSVEEALKIAMACVSQNSAHYPTMNQLVLKLKQCLQIERARLIMGGQPFVS